MHKHAVARSYACGTVSEVCWQERDRMAEMGKQGDKTRTQAPSDRRTSL